MKQSKNLRINSEDFYRLCVHYPQNIVTRYASSYGSIQEILDKASLTSLERKKLQKISTIAIADPGTYYTFIDSEWPMSLQEVRPQPSILFYLGNWECIKADKKLGVVGSRTISDYSKHITPLLLKGLRGENIPIVSGLAYGVDILAHDLALHNGLPTIAVLAGGLDSQSIYPKEHTPYIKKILDSNGLILSEYPPGTRPEKYHFPLRNRIIGMLSDVLLVVQANAKSGSLITAELAVELGKTVATIPARVGDALFEGNLELLSQGAHIVTKSEDIDALLGIAKLPRTSQALIPDNQVLRILHSAPETIEGLCEKLELDLPDVLRELTFLELQGSVKKQGESWFLV